MLAYDVNKGDFSVCLDLKIQFSQILLNCDVTGKTQISAVTPSINIRTLANRSLSLCLTHRDAGNVSKYDKRQSRGDATREREIHSFPVASHSGAASSATTHRNFTKDHE